MEIASKYWQSEGKNWDVDTCYAEDPETCYHFTQQMWKGTTHMCYAYSKAGFENMAIFVFKSSQK